MSKKTAIFGATPNPTRYAFLAAQRLLHSKHEIVPVGIKKGEVLGKEILDLRQTPKIPDLDTITMYIGPYNQAEWEDYIISLNPKRIIFNPGSENDILANRAKLQGIEVLYACTLVMLGNDLY